MSEEKKLSQFEKRKLKDKMVKVVETVVAPVVSEVAATEAPTTHIGYDIFFDKTLNKHKVAILAYNPETGAARVDGIMSIDRGVALSYDVQKTALKKLYRK